MNGKNHPKFGVEIELGEFVVMPNHFHGIVIIQRRGIRPDAPTTTSEITAKQWGPAPQSIGALVAGFKSIVTKRINQIRNTPGLPVWQRNYWEHIIRNQKSYQRITEYIIRNPVLWNRDKLFMD